MALTCAQCSGEFEPKTVKQPYCNDRCRSKGKAAKQKKQRHARRDVVACLWCGADISMLSARAKYCSDEHQRRGYSTTRTREEPCTISWCTRPLVARGWCQAHYERWRTTGDPETPYHWRRGDLNQRLWNRLDHKPSGCWEWQGTVLPDRYGGLMYEGKKVRAHRLAWELTYGPIEDGLWVLHRCDNRICCNPDHLFLGTADDNVQDMISKRRGWWQVGAQGPRELEKVSG